MVRWLSDHISTYLFYVLHRDKDRKDFLKVAVPVLGEILGDRGAMAILDKGLVILSLSAIDITDDAIARVNAALAEPPAAQP